jgi:hypothetical protein
LKTKGTSAEKSAKRWVVGSEQWVAETGIAVPPPRVFLQKSLDLLDSKGVDGFESAKEFVRVSNDKS